MSAPERIKVARCHPYKEPDDLYVCHPRLQNPAAVEYIRADLVPQWQPIETAPRDGTEVLLFGRGVAHIGRFEAEQDETGEFGWYSREDDWLGGFCSPTHWKPLDTPPEAD